MAVRKAKWQNDYIDKTYDRINLTVPKGNKEIIKEAAYRCGESVNGFINRLIDAELERLKIMQCIEGNSSEIWEAPSNEDIRKLLDLPHTPDEN